MARAPITPLRLDPAVKADWQARAAARGLSLSEFVRREVDRDKLVASGLPEPVGRRAAVSKGFGATSSARDVRPFSKEQQAGRTKR